MHTRSKGPLPKDSTMPSSPDLNCQSIPIPSVPSFAENECSDVDDLSTPRESPVDDSVPVPTQAPNQQELQGRSDGGELLVQNGTEVEGAVEDLAENCEDKENDENEEPLTLDRIITNLNNAPDTDVIAMARGTTNNSEGYTSRRRKIIDEFLSALWEVTPKYDAYLKKTRRDVPAFFPSPEVEYLFVLLSGPEEKKKKVMILNNMLVDWIGAARKKKVDNGSSIYHSPSTLNYMLRSFFSTTKEYYNWLFTTSDFNFEGGFNGFFKSLCAQRLKEDVSVSACVIVFVF